MNEILVRKYIKKVLSYGVPKLMAKEIVDLAMESGGEKHIETYIEYAIGLIYGSQLLNKRKANNL
jgi:hypothetical protein